MTVDTNAPRNPSQVLLGDSLIKLVRPKKNPGSEGRGREGRGGVGGGGGGGGGGREISEVTSLIPFVKLPNKYAMMSLHITMETGRRNQKGASNMFCMMR